MNDDKDRYEGFLRTSAPELFGKCTYACGDVYVGEWASGQPHGRGLHSSTFQLNLSRF